MVAACAGKLGFQAVLLMERQLSTCRNHISDAFSKTSAATSLDVDTLTRACAASVEAAEGALPPYLDPRFKLTSSSPSLAPEHLKLERTVVSATGGSSRGGMGLLRAPGDLGW